MGWFNSWTNTLKNKICCYVLKNIIGGYIKNKITLEQMRISLENGVGSLEDFELDSEVFTKIL